MSDRSIYIKTDPTTDGYRITYRVTLELSEDDVHILSREQAYAHAGHVLAAAQRAEYDAAIIRQLRPTLTEKGRKPDEALRDAAMILNDIRQERPPLPDPPTPLCLKPGVSQRTGNGFLAVHVGEEAVGQWEVEDARQHALVVLECIEAADLDGGYLKTLTGTLGIPHGTAENMVGDIANHREAK